MADKKPRGDMQSRILAYIESEIKTRGYAPSVREIGEAVGLKSTSTVHGHLTRLEKKGLLHRDAMKPRAMGLPFPSSPAYDTSKMRQIPVIGRVAAGIPILAEENVEEILPLPADVVGDGDLFALRVRGESMIQAGIMNNEATVKRFYRECGHIRLQPENDAMSPIIVPSVTILGKVVSLIRRF